MDASIRHLGCWMLVSGLALSIMDGQCYAAPQQVADASQGDEKSGDSVKEDAGQGGQAVASLLSMGIVRVYFYNAAKGFLILSAFWVVGIILLNVIRRVGRVRHIDEGLAEFLGRVVKVAALVVGAITALSEMGIDVGALVAGLGLTGFAFGFAFKDIISNVLAGVLIIIYKPFQVGDQIKIKAYAGNVVSIDLRYTVLNTDGNMVYVPNSLLFTDAIIVENKAAVAEAAAAEG